MLTAEIKTFDSKGMVQTIIRTYRGSEGKKQSAEFRMTVVGLLGSNEIKAKLLFHFGEFEYSFVHSDGTAEGYKCDTDYAHLQMMNQLALLDNPLVAAAWDSSMHQFVHEMSSPSNN